MLEIGSLVDGKYKILNKIGQGGMSVVYLAMNEKANKQWAIKEVRKDGKKDFDVIRQGLVVETDMLKRLKHPHLPSIVDVIDGDGTFLIVMDYIEGNPLNVLVNEQGAQSQEDVIDWAKQLCDVLGYLHSRTPAIIYRDMKPSNVMLKPDGNVMLIDLVLPENTKIRTWWRIQPVLELRDMRLRSSLEGMVRLMPERIFIAWEQLCIIWLLVIIRLNLHMRCIR